MSATAPPPALSLPLTREQADDFYEWMFAPWVRAQGHQVVELAPGRVVTRVPQDPAQHHFAGFMCGQAVMSAIDTAMAMAMMTVEPAPTRGTASQNTRFLKSAAGGDLLVEAKVLKAGRAVWYGEALVRVDGKEELVAHATCEFL